MTVAFYATKLGVLIFFAYTLTLIPVTSQPHTVTCFLLHTKNEKHL